MIGCARESGGLYFFEDGSSMIRPIQNTCYSSVSITNDKKIMLWHFRLGHPNFHYLRYLLPNLFNNKDQSLFQCEICQLAKHRRSTFSIQPYQPPPPQNHFYYYILMYGDQIEFLICQEKDGLVHSLTITLEFVGYIC